MPKPSETPPLTTAAAETPEILRRFRPLIQAEMRALLEGRTLPLYDMVRYHLGWQEADGRPRIDGGGKGMRPALCLLTAEALDPSPAAQRRALAGAAAVELVHNYSLVHDDIQDGDSERHHRPTVWKQWGLGQGINVGDALRELAQLALQRAFAAGAAPEVVLAAQAALTEAGLEMIEGQYQDLTFEERTEIALPEYQAMIDRKTGAMVGCSLQLGALLARGDQATAARLRLTGRRLGVLFQIRDDYLGVWGDSARTGKSSNNDIRRRKKSFPVVYALTAAGPAEQSALRRIYAQPSLSDADVQTVMAILTAVDAQGATERAAREQYDGFLQEIRAGLLPPTGEAAFTAVADFLRQREH